MCVLHILAVETGGHAERRAAVWLFVVAGVYFLASLLGLGEAGEEGRSVDDGQRLRRFRAWDGVLGGCVSLQVPTFREGWPPGLGLLQG